MNYDIDELSYKKGYDEGYAQGKSETIDAIECHGNYCSAKGCDACGGFGYVLVRRNCPTCHTSYWVQPHVMTLYDGKQYNSKDGLKIVHRANGKSTCHKCPKK